MASSSSSSTTRKDNWMPPSVFGKNFDFLGSSSSSREQVEDSNSGFELRPMGSNDGQQQHHDLSSSAAATSGGRYGYPGSLHLPCAPTTTYRRLMVISTVGLAVVLVVVLAFSFSPPSPLDATVAAPDIVREADTVVPDGVDGEDVSWDEIKFAFHTLANSVLKMNFTLPGSDIQ